MTGEAKVESRGKIMCLRNYQIFQMLTLWLCFFTTPNAMALSNINPIKIPARQDSYAITFYRLVIQKSDLSGIGEAADKCRSLFLRELRKFGYNALSTEDILLDAGDRPRLVLGGTIKNIQCEEVSNQERICDIDVLWELFDRQIKKVIYQMNARNRKRIFESSAEEDRIQLLLGALHSLLARQKFVGLVTKKTDVPTTSQKQWRTANYQLCKVQKLPLPKNLEKAIKASVMVKGRRTVGSGVLISPDGYILTASHVVARSSEVAIQDSEGRIYTAQVIRVNREDDLALLKAPGRDFSCLRTAMVKPNIGETVFLIGAPIGSDLVFTVTRGIASGIRKFNGREYVQTDAAANPGNSGGPLLSENGRVTGIVISKVAILGYEGLSFAVPTSRALEALAIAPGTVSNIETTALKIAKNAKTNYPIVDQDDPIKPIPLVDTELKKHVESRKDVGMGWLYSIPTIVGAIGFLYFTPQGAIKRDTTSVTLALLSLGVSCGGIVGLYTNRPSQQTPSAQDEIESDGTFDLAWGFSGQGFVVSGRF